MGFSVTVYTGLLTEIQSLQKSFLSFEQAETYAKGLLLQPVYQDRRARFITSTLVQKDKNDRGIPYRISFDGTLTSAHIVAVGDVLIEHYMKTLAPIIQKMKDGKRCQVLGMYMVDDEHVLVHCVQKHFDLGFEGLPKLSSVDSLLYAYALTDKRLNVLLSLIWNEQH